MHYFSICVRGNLTAGNFFLRYGHTVQPPATQICKLQNGYLICLHSKCINLLHTVLYLSPVHHFQMNLGLENEPWTRKDWPISPALHQEVNAKFLKWQTSKSAHLCKFAINNSPPRWKRKKLFWHRKQNFLEEGKGEGSLAEALTLWQH